MNTLYPSKTLFIFEEEKTLNNNSHLSQKEQLINIENGVKNGIYKSLRDIEKDYPIIVYTRTNFIQKIINKNLKINPLTIKPVKLIWLHGRSGAGKTTWTNKYLRKSDYSDNDITVLSLFCLSSKVYFEIWDQFKKVLIINEVDQNFPHYTDLVAWIKRISLLPVKGVKIPNNYELIIVNSIYSPEEVFTARKQDIKALNQLYHSNFDLKVYQVSANEKQLKEAKHLNLSIIEFENWYNPTVELFKDTGYSLVKD